MSSTVKFGLGHEVGGEGIDVAVAWASVGRIAHGVLRLEGATDVGAGPGERVPGQLIAEIHDVQDMATDGAPRVHAELYRAPVRPVVCHCQLLGVLVRS